MINIKSLFLHSGAPSEPNIWSEGAAPQIDKLHSSQSLAKGERVAASLDVVISLKAKIFMAVSAFKSSLGTLSGTDFKVVSNAPSTVEISVTTPSHAKAFSADIIVRQLANPQIIVFRLTQNTKPETALCHIVSPLKVATTETTQTLSISGGKVTVKKFVQSLNDISGLKSSLVQTENGLVIIVKTLPGASQALQPTSVDAIQQMLWSSTKFGNRSLVVAMREIAAQDTVVDLNGKELTFAENRMESLVPGYVVTALKLGQAYLQSEETIASLLTRMTALMREINTLIKHLVSIAYSVKSAANLPTPAERLAAQALLHRLRKIVSQPIYGFARTPVLPATLGIEAAETGAIDFDEDCFEMMAAQERNMIAAIFGATKSQNTLLQEHDKAKAIPMNRLMYSLIYNPMGDTVTATLNGSPLAVQLAPQGHPILSLNDETHEVFVVLNANEPTIENLAYGHSLLDKLNDFATYFLNSDSRVTSVDTGLQANLQALEHNTAQSNSLVSAIFFQPLASTDGTQTNAVSSMPPKAAELLVYLLWIGVWVSSIERDRSKRRRNQKKYGWRR
ncbi:hypothetical protein OA238_118p0830 (plasmid) [Octadecabacter arcticus 238]|jgi:hypothetical protein|uniref:Uncharacterized protein n=1 Tax=Octadecabacter arcticus 238 TaxID=391616 RepID=M9RWA4_9RHOB|nr:hypothetical protein [Octadecabacter arcticus]AGI74781.1 hypothetical protein OA238_118p0830 [Octadecabacter arcticus 238]